MTKRVVVTGMGVVSPVGNGVETFWNSLRRGDCGIGRIEAFDTSEYPSQIGGESQMPDLSDVIDKKEARRTSRFILFALGAADMAMKQAGLGSFSPNDPTRCATIIGSGIGGLGFLEEQHKKLVTRHPSRVSPFLIPMMIPDMASGRVSIQYGFKGPNYATVTACASGGHAIGETYQKIKNDAVDIAITGGAESTITPLALAGFSNMKALSTRNDDPKSASRPFDKERDGFVMAEGAGILILESLEHARQRNATILGEVIGYGSSGDAYHITAPQPDGSGMAAALSGALDDAGVQPETIEYINAHGTSTPPNDKIETAAMKTVFGDVIHSVSISSTKSMTGHLLGASGGIECIATLCALRDGFIPPTINYQNPDPECDLDYTPNTGKNRTIEYAVSNSFGFGGHNASLILKKYV